MRRRPGRDSDPLGVAGWVLAELMLVLVIVFIGTQLGDPNAGLNTAAAGPTTTTTTTAEPPPETTATTTTLPPAGIESGYVCVVIPAVAELAGDRPVTIADVDAVLERTRSKLESADWPYRDRKLGMVLVWGIAPKDLSRKAKDLAELFEKKILSQLQDPWVSETEKFPTRTFWHGMGGEPGHVMLDIYFVAEAGLPDSALVPAGNEADWKSSDPSTPRDCYTWETWEKP